MFGQHSSITKVNEFLIMQKPVMVLVHCFSTHRDIAAIEFQVDTSYTCSRCAMLRIKFKCEK